MSKTRKDFRLSPTCLEGLEAIQKLTGVSGSAAAVEFAVQFLIENKELLQKQNHELELMKRYLNELRRGTWITHDLLNALCIAMNISVVPRHDNDAFKGTALREAEQNTTERLTEIFARKKLEGSGK